MSYGRHGIGIGIYLRLVSSGWKVERRGTDESGCGAWVEMKENER